MIPGKNTKGAERNKPKGKQWKWENKTAICEKEINSHWGKDSTRDITVSVFIEL